MPISDDLKRAIIDDIREGRLTFAEIAAKRLGNPKRKGEISRFATSAGISRKDRRGRPKKSFLGKVSSQNSVPGKPIKIETFEKDTRLALIDEALSYLKANLPQIKHPKGFSEWTSALDRLLNQRRIEAPAAPSNIEDDGFMAALETKTPEVWKDAPNIPIQMDSSEHTSMENIDLVGDRLADQELERDSG